MPVTLRGVGHRFNERPWLFRHLDYEYEPGGVYAVTGPSGSGKSTLLSLLARLGVPSEGTIEFTNVTRIGWVFQNPFGSPRRTALDHVTLPLLGLGLSTEDAERQAHELLTEVGLSEVIDRQFRELSGGEAQRLMLARGLAAKPDLLLVDEPTAQLDRTMATQVNRALATTATEHMIVIVATHDAETRAACTHHFDLASFAPSFANSPEAPEARATP